MNADLRFMGMAPDSLLLTVGPYVSLGTECVNYMRLNRLGVKKQQNLAECLAYVKFLCIRDERTI
jgi:hypothetical protein